MEKKCLLYQAQKAFRIWHGIKPEINEEFLKFLNEKNWNFRGYRIG